MMHDIVIYGTEQHAQSFGYQAVDMANFIQKLLVKSLEKD